MLRIINGGIYSIKFQGRSSSEFDGVHPSLVVQTLKEKEVYLVIPLTTYSREKMAKVKKDGYGKRILSTNSIARIDKIQIVHRREIKNRWMNGNTSLKIDPNEYATLLGEVEKYINLTGQKSQKEHDKYLNQYDKVFNYLKAIFQGNHSEENIFRVNQIGDNKVMKCRLSEFHWLSENDIKEMVNLI